MTIILETGAQSAQADHRVAGTLFRCCDCGECKPVQHSGGTGYAIDRETDKLICYACVAVRDRAKMLETGKAVLYLTEEKDSVNPDARARWFVTNWPGTLRFPVYANAISYSWHNFAGKNGRRDFDFRGPDGFLWHGTNIGDSQIARVRCTKNRHVSRQRDL